ncbi:hypothetical protein [Flavobacterium sp.]|nr:hypothetical protein [Flavobacterium sp.]
MYKQSVAECTDDFAMECAEGCYENRDTEGASTPEDDAREDLSYWDDE